MIKMQQCFAMYQIEWTNKRYYSIFTPAAPRFNAKNSVEEFIWATRKKTLHCGWSLSSLNLPVRENCQRNSLHNIIATNSHDYTLNCIWITEGRSITMNERLQLNLVDSIHKNCENEWYFSNSSSGECILYFWNCCIIQPSVSRIRWQKIEAPLMTPRRDIHASPVASA